MQMLTKTDNAIIKVE